MEKYKVCVVTGTRAEYGLLKPILLRLKSEEDVELLLAVTGAHLSMNFGHTIDAIVEDGFEVSTSIECLSDGIIEINMPIATAKAMSGFAEYFSQAKPQMVVVLGDRYEIFGAATAAAMLNIPIAHLYGGDTTEGAIDEFLRHSITKMSYLHFASNEQSARRLIQLGENPNRVFNVGSLGAENIKSMQLMSFEELQESVGLSLDKPFAVVTFHPVTLENSSVEMQFNELLKAIDQSNNMKFIFTKANADSGGIQINQMIDQFVDTRDNCVAFESLGQKRYFSALKYASMVIGNSSSGMYEAPLFGIPTVNIGDRQKGRLQPKTIINTEPKAQGILNSMKVALEQGKAKDCFDGGPYYKPNTADSIVRIIIETLHGENIDLKKKFYDLENI